MLHVHVLEHVHVIHVDDIIMSPNPNIEYH